MLRSAATFISVLEGRVSLSLSSDDQITNPKESTISKLFNTSIVSLELIIIIYIHIDIA